MAGVAGAPAPKPQSLGSPVPGKEAELTAEALFADTPTAEALFAEAPTEAAPDVPAEIPEDQFASEPGFVEANLDQLNPENVVTRIQAGLAANDTEKLGFLKKKFGDDNAVMKKGKIYFRRNGEKFKPLDPDTLELINDILPDFSREIVTEMAMLPGEMMGASMGTAMAPGAGTVAGAMAGRVAQVPFANNVANQVAQAAGIPQDPARDVQDENMMGQGAEAVFPVVGKKIVGAIAKRLPGTTAYSLAKQQGKREIVALSEQSKEVAQAVDDLVREGRAATIDGNLVGVPGANVPLMGHQLNPDNPILNQFAAKSAQDPRFINAQNQLAEDWGESLKNTLTEIGRRNNKGPLRPEALASTVTNAVADLQKAEGQAIGKYRAQAMAKLKNQKLPLGPEAQNQLGGLMTELGFRRQAKGDVISIIPPKDLNALVGKLGLTSIGEVRAVVNNVNELAQASKKGINISDLDRLRNSLGSTSDSLFRTQAGARLGALTGELRKAYRTGIESGLENDFERAAFNSAMDDFSMLRENVTTLKRALNEDASAQAIVKSFFTGKENLQKIKAIKQISPESFGALKEEWVNQLLMEYGSRKSATGLKSTQFLDAINKKYGDQFMREVMNDGPGPNIDTVKKILTVTERIEDTYHKVGVDKMSEQQKKGVMDAAIGLVANIKFKTINGLSALLRGRGPQDSVLMQIMTRDGIDKYIAEYPGKIDKIGTYKKFNDLLAQTRFYKMADEAAKSQAAKAASEYGKRVILRGGIKQQRQESGE